jgi:Zn finger protein HypA/HybF involved in hydrogenase expression
MEYTYDNDNPEYICEACGNELDGDEQDHMMCGTCKDHADPAPRYQCQDCGEIDTTVTLDAYPVYLCPTCTSTRRAKGEDEAARRAWLERTGMPT